MAQKSKSTTSANSNVVKKEKDIMPLGKMNYIMIAVSILLIALGFALMTGSTNEGNTFNPDVFSSTRTVVAPFITFLGFVLMVPAIMFRGKKKAEQQQQ